MRIKICVKLACKQIFILISHKSPIREQLHPKGQTMETKHLRSGFTTGTCASAAAKAAAVFLLTGNQAETVTLTLPSGTEGSWSPVPCEEMEYEGFFKVRKDAGDDPDVTNGTWVCAGVFPITRGRLEFLKEQGKGYWLERYPDLYINGGTGIGLATKPGLSCPPGHYAINPVPRMAILDEVWQVCRQAAYEGCLEVRVSIPEGECLSKKTFNPRLGIEGGISVLGTSGIVKPMSEEALLETIRLDIHMKAAAGEKILLLAPGNYGETFLKESMDVPLGAAVLCSNFVGNTVDVLVEEKISKILFVGHIGKLIKVSAGVKNTHSRYGDGRMQQMAELTRQAAPERQSLYEAVLRCNTTEEAVGILRAVGLAGEILDLAAKGVETEMEMWSGKRLEVQVVTFSSAYGILGSTGQAQELLALWKQQREDRNETGGNQLYKSGEPGLREAGEAVPGAGHSL